MASASRAQREGTKERSRHRRLIAAGLVAPVVLGLVVLAWSALLAIHFEPTTEALYRAHYAAQLGPVGALATAFGLGALIGWLLAKHPTSRQKRLVASTAALSAVLSLGGGVYTHQKLRPFRPELHVLNTFPVPVGAHYLGQRMIAEALPSATRFWRVARPIETACSKVDAVFAAWVDAGSHATQGVQGGLCTATGRKGRDVAAFDVVPRSEAPDLQFGVTVRRCPAHGPCRSGL